MFGKILTIEIGSMYTKVADIDVNNKKYTICRSIVVQTPDGTYDDGYITNDDKLVDLLYEQFNKYDVRKRRVAFQISSSKIINREIVLPYVSKNKITPMLMANASEYFPVDITKYKVSWKIMNFFTDDNIKKMKLMAIAVPQDLLDTYYKLANDIGMSVEIIDYAGNSIYQLLKNANKEGSFVSVHVSERSTMVSVIRNGILDLQRTIPYGLFDVMNNIADANGLGKIDYFALLDDLKKEALINTALPMEDEEFDVENHSEVAVRARNTEALRPFVERIVRIIHYYTSNMGNGQLDQLILTGVGTSIQNFPQLLQFELGLPIEDVSICKNIKMAPGLKKKEDEEKQTAFEVLEDDVMLDISAIAIGIGSLVEPLDLLSKNLRTTKNTKANLTTAIICCVLGVTTAGLLSGYSILSLKSAQKQKTTLENRINELSSVDQIIQKHDSIVAVYTSMKDMNLNTRTANEDMVKLIAYLEQNLPEDATVTAISFSSSGVNMTIETGSWPEAADTLTMLQNIPCFENVGMTGVTQGTRTTTTSVELFEVDGEIYESLDDVDLLNEDGSYKTVNVVGTDSSVEESYCTFSCNCTYKAVGTYTFDIAADTETTVEEVQ